MIITNRKEFDRLLSIMAEAKTVYMDTETSGLKAFKGDRICGVGVAFDLEETWYLPFRHEGDLYEGGNLPEEWLFELTVALSKVPSIVGFNIKFDLTMLWHDGYRPIEEQQMVDVLVMARLVVPEKHPPGGLKLETMMDRFLGRGEGNYNKVLEQWMRKAKLWVDKPKDGIPIRKYHHVPIDTLGPYCINDVIGTVRLRKVFQQLIIDKEEVKVWKGEIRSTKVFFEMELEGVKVDIEYCDEAITKISQRQADLEQELFKLVGTEFNLNSPAQVVTAFNNIGVHSPIKTDGGKSGIKKESFGKDALKAMGDSAHPAVKLIREYSSWGTLRTTYLEVFKATKGVVHCSYKQHGTITGRISCADPNMQNLPRSARTAIEQDVLDDLLSEGFNLVDMTTEAGDYDESDPRMVAARRALVPREGYELVAIDYSQMEMLVFLCYVNNQSLLKLVEQSYLAGTPFDFHVMVAEEVWGPKYLEDGSENPEFSKFRGWAKAINFGIVYGIGKKLLASNLGVTQDEAAEYKENYFARIEGAETFIEAVANRVRSNGFIYNFFGRRYYIDPGREYIGVNYLVQGSCADFMKDRMWRVRKAIQGTGARILIQVHDELVLEVPTAKVASVAKTVQTIMEEKVFAISLPTEASRCPNSWIEKFPIEQESEKELVAA